MYKLAIVLRYLRRHKITIFPIAGVALGVMALIVVLSVMKGFETDFRRSIRGIMPDMSLEFRDIYGYQGDIDELLRRIEGVPEVKATSPYVSGVALAMVQVPYSDSPLWEEMGKGAAGTGAGEDGEGGDAVGAPGGRVGSTHVYFKGFDFEREARVVDLQSHLMIGADTLAKYPYDPNSKELQPAGYIVGARVAGRRFEDLEEMGDFGPGMSTDVSRKRIDDWGRVPPGASVRLMTFTPAYERAVVRGVATDVVKSGIQDIDSSTVFMDINWARRLREVEPNTISGVGIALKSYSFENAKIAKAKIFMAMRDIAPPGQYDYDITTWEESRKTLLTAVAMERRIMAFILFFFLVVAGFSISAILILIVLEKVRDIGILRAMGASANGAAGIFLMYGVMIGLLGALIGLALGVAFVSNIDYIEQAVYHATVILKIPDENGWQPFPPEIYDLPAIPRIIDWWTNMQVVATAFLVSLLASVIPAWRAARLKPVEAIRYE